MEGDDCNLIQGNILVSPGIAEENREIPQSIEPVTQSIFKPCAVRVQV
jgi:hypothetical protein